jgi:hypothetical protein
VALELLYLGAGEMDGDPRVPRSVSASVSQRLGLGRSLVAAKPREIVLRLDAEFLGQ